MGDAQSAQREARRDAAEEEEEEGGRLDDALTGQSNGQSTGETPLKNSGHFSEINGKADGTLLGVNGHYESESAAEAFICHVEEPPLEIADVIQKGLSDDDVKVAVEKNEMGEKQNDGDGFKNIFSNIGLKFTIRRDSRRKSEIAADEILVEKTQKNSRDEDAGVKARSDRSEESQDNDSTSCPTLTDVTLEDVLETAEGEEAAGDPATTCEDDKTRQTSASGPDQEAPVSPIKRLFKTGLFSGLRKKKKAAEDTETTEKEPVHMEKKDDEEGMEQTQTDQDLVEALEFQEKTSTAAHEAGGKVQSSPLKRLFAGSASKKMPKKQRGSDANLSESGDQVSEQLSSSTESAEYPKEDGPAQPATEATVEEDSAWATFKKLLTPKRRLTRSSLTSEEMQIPALSEEPKKSEGEQLSDHSTEESRRRKDSSVSWEAVLCGSGRRRSQKMSDFEDETPQIENVDNKREEPRLESSTEMEVDSVSSPKQAGSPSEAEGRSTWQSFKRLVTTKRKAKDEEETKQDVLSQTEVTQEENSFSDKKPVTAVKKRKPDDAEQGSSDEADKESASDDDESETPAIVPLSEFDGVETEAPVPTQADVACRSNDETDREPRRDLPAQTPEPTQLPGDLETKEARVLDNDDNLENQAPATPAAHEEFDDFTDFISRYQQLSDIPEEDMMTETNATPASAMEEAAPEDTVAEDVTDITSEVFTAPEPLEPDETEMISAVSQLSESSKTSGNITPVPAKYELHETERLLLQVVETISATPRTVPVVSEEPNSEKIVGSVAHQVNEPCVEQKPTVLESHRVSEATAISTGLNVNEFEAVDDLVATSQTESIGEVDEAVSTEITSEIPTADFGTAELNVDEVVFPEVSVSQLQESSKALENGHEGECLVDSPTEMIEAVSSEIWHGSQEMIIGEGAVLQAEVEPPKSDDAELAAAPEVSETTEEAPEQEAQLPSDTEGNDVTVKAEGRAPSAERELQELTAAQEHTDLQERGIESSETEVQSEDIQTEEAVNDEPKGQTESAEVEAVQEVTVQVGVQSSESKTVSEDPSGTETSADELKEITEDVVDTKLDTESKDIPVDETAQDEVEEILDAVVPTQLHPEEVNVEGEVEEFISEDAPKAEVGVDELKREGDKESPTEVNAEGEEAPETELIPEREIYLPATDTEVQSEEGDGQVPRLKEITEVTSEEETTADEGKEVAEADAELAQLPAEAAKAEPEQESEVLPCDEVDHVTEIDSVAEKQTKEEAEALEPEKEEDVEGVPKPEAETEEITSQEYSETKEDRDTQNNTSHQIPHDTEVEVEQCKPEAAEVVYVACINKEPICVRNLEKAEASEDTPVPCVDSAEVTDEPEHEVQLSGAGVVLEAEKEDELPAAAVEAMSAEQDVLPQVSTCSSQMVLATLPDVSVENSSDILEPLVDTRVGQLEYKETAETAAPLLREDTAETAKLESVDRMMRMPVLKREDKHRIRVQEVDVDVKSAETSADFDVNDDKKVTDVWHEAEDELNNLSASAQEEVIQEEQNVTIAEVIPDVKEPQSNVVKLNDEVIKEAIVASVTSILNEVVKGESATILSKKTDEALQPEGDASAVSADVKIPKEVVPESFDASLRERKEDLGGTEAPQVSPEKEAKCSAQEVNKPATEEPKVTEQIESPGNSGVIIPGNTGIISSIGNVESPSSLSLEFKLNIQFGQTKAPAFQPPTAEKTEPKQTDVSGRDAEAAENPKQANPAESQKQEGPAGAPRRAKEMIETEMSSVLIRNPMVVMDVSKQAAEREEPVEETKSTNGESSNIQARETTEAEARVLGKNAKEPVKEPEEELDQEVWMDAEENINSQVGKKTPELEEPLEFEQKSVEEDKDALEDEFEIAPTAAEEEQMEKERRDVDSEGEDFAVAPEDPEVTTAASANVIEWD